jgi:hypothetical protein
MTEPSWLQWVVEMKRDVTQIPRPVSCVSSIWASRESDTGRYWGPREVRVSGIPGLSQQSFAAVRRVCCRPTRAAGGEAKNRTRLTWTTMGDVRSLCRSGDSVSLRAGEEPTISVVQVVLFRALFGSLHTLLAHTWSLRLCEGRLTVARCWICEGHSRARHKSRCSRK